MKTSIGVQLYLLNKDDTLSHFEKSVKINILLSDLNPKLKNKAYEEYELLKEEKLKIAILKSAQKLNTTAVKKVQKNLEEQKGAQVVIIEEIDTSLLGGFLVEIDDNVLDLSVRKEIDDIEIERDSQ